MYYLYQIVCTHPEENGKRYIGFTANPKSRRYTHFSLPYGKSYLHDAIRRLGAKWFTFSILAEFEDRERALAAEVGLIRRLGVRHPNGYNLIDSLQYVPQGIRVSKSWTLTFLQKRGELEKYLRMRDTAEVYHFKYRRRH